ncbi:MAG: ribosome silencing factor [Candidatus Aminicenantes bacterium]|nr:ribosome silencing factor [Candidatus Aminicenantes bacterium]
MTKEKKFTRRNLPPEVRLSLKICQAKKAENIIVLDLRGLASFTDFFIIMHGNSTRQNQAIYQAIEENLGKEKVFPIGVEGEMSGEWILMDYGHFIIHIFSRRARDYYALEKLWGDAPSLIISS